MPTLSSLLLQREVATLREVDSALARQVVRGGDLCTNLLELSRIDEARLLEAIGDAAELEPLPPGHLQSPSPFAVEKLSAAMAQRYAVVPLFLDDQGLVVAVANPLPPSVVEDFAFSTGVKLVQRISTIARVRECISRAYRVPLDRRFARIIARLDGLADPSPTLRPPKPDTSKILAFPPQPPLPVLEETVPFGPVKTRSSGPPTPELSLPPIQGVRRRPQSHPLGTGQRRRGPFTLSMATQELGEASSHNAILWVFFDFSKQFFDYSALFVVKGDLAEGSHAHGRGADNDRVRGVGVPLELPSILSLARDRRTHVRVLPSTTGIDAVLRADLQRPMATSVLVIPVIVRNRVVALLYGDDGDSSVDIATVGDVLAFAPLVGAAFEELILRKKIQGSGAQQSAPPKQEFYPEYSEYSVPVGDPEAKIHELQWSDAEEPSYPVVAPFPSQRPMHLGPPPGQRRSITTRLSAVPQPELENSPAAASLRQPEPFRAASDLPPPFPAPQPVQAPAFLEPVLEPETSSLDLSSNATPEFVGARVELAETAASLPSPGDFQELKISQETKDSESAVGAQVQLAETAPSPPQPPVVSQELETQEAKLDDSDATVGAGAESAETAVEPSPVDSQELETPQEAKLEDSESAPVEEAFPLVPSSIRASSAEAPAPAEVPAPDLVEDSQQPTSEALLADVSPTAHATQAGENLPDTADSQIESPVVEKEKPNEEDEQVSPAGSDSAPILAASHAEDSPTVSIADADDAEADEMVQAVIAELERSPAPTGALKPNPFLEAADARESWVAQGAIVFGPQRIPRSNPPSDVGLPSVIVDVQGEVEALISELLSQGEPQAAALLARRQLLVMRDMTAKVLFEKLPGPLKIDPKAETDFFPRASECGPLLDLAVALGQASAVLVIPTALSAAAEQRWWALLLLAEIGGKDAVEPIVRGLFDDDPLIRKASRSGARMLVGVHGLARAVAEPLQKVLLHERESIDRRVAAVEILGEFRDARFVPVLLQTLESQHDSLRTASFAALRILCRQDLPEQAEAWNKWWEANKTYPRVQWLIDAIGAESPSVREAASRELAEISGDDFGFSTTLSREDCSLVQELASDWWRSMERNRETDPPAPPH